MKIQFNSNYGNFKTQLTATVPDGSNKVISEEGLANILYRVCGSGVDKAFGLKKGNKRTEIVYSVDNAAKVTKAVENKIMELCGVSDEAGFTAGKDAAEYESLELAFKVTGQHEAGESASAMVRATTLVDTFLADDKMEGAYRTIFGLQGLEDAENADREALIEFAHSKGLGVQPAKKK